jgi:hypothetical protein
VRTTLTIDDDLYQAAKNIAIAEHKSIGEIISFLIRKALMSKDYSEVKDDIPSFRVSEKVSPLTPEMVREADEDGCG